MHEIALFYKQRCHLLRCERSYVSWYNTPDVVEVVVIATHAPEPNTEAPGATCQLPRVFVSLSQLHDFLIWWLQRLPTYNCL